MNEWEFQVQYLFCELAVLFRAFELDLVVRLIGALFWVDGDRVLLVFDDMLLLLLDEVVVVYSWLPRILAWFVLFEIRPAVLCSLFTFVVLEFVVFRIVLLKLLDDDGIATLFSRAELLAITAEFKAACAAKRVLRLVLIDDCR